MTLDLQQLQDADVVDKNGEKVGNVAQIFVDDTTNQPSFTSIKTGVMGGANTFVPLAGAQSVDGKLQVPYTADFINESPRVDVEGHISAQEQSELYGYYGLTDPSAAGVAGTAGNSPSTREQAELSQPGTFNEGNRGGDYNDGVGAGTYALDGQYVGDRTPSDYDAKHERSGQVFDEDDNPGRRGGQVYDEPRTQDPRIAQGDGQSAATYAASTSHIDANTDAVDEPVPGRDAATDVTYADTASRPEVAPSGAAASRSTSGAGKESFFDKIKDRLIGGKK